MDPRELNHELDSTTSSRLPLIGDPPHFLFCLSPASSGCCCCTLQTTLLFFAIVSLVMGVLHCVVALVSLASPVSFERGMGLLLAASGGVEVAFGCITWAAASELSATKVSYSSILAIVDFVIDVVYAIFMVLRDVSPEYRETLAQIFEKTAGLNPSPEELQQFVDRSVRFSIGIDTVSLVLSGLVLLYVLYILWSFKWRVYLGDVTVITRGRDSHIAAGPEPLIANEVQMQRTTIQA